MSKFTSADEAPAWDIQVLKAPWFTWISQTQPQAGTPAIEAWPPEEPMSALRQQVPRWARSSVVRAPDTDDVSTGRWRVQIGLGWPLRSMYGGFTGLHGGPPAEAHDGLDLRSILGRKPDPKAPKPPYTPSSDVLPISPIWPGFAITSGLFALIIFTTWAGLVRLVYERRASRLKRGLCPACRYPLTNAGTCPECGRAPSPRP